MKKSFIFYTAILCLSFLQNSFAQDIPGQLENAKQSYKSGNLDDARFALQEALIAIDKIIGEKIISELPVKIENMSYMKENDNVTSTSLGFAGVYVNRDYASDKKSAKIEVITDSPLLAGINTLLAMPSFVASQDENQKRIKIKGYKGLLNKDTDDEGNITYTVQIPIQKSLLTCTIKGENDENAVMGMVNTIPIDKIAKLAQ